MTEQVIFLEGIDPVILFGPNNQLFDKIKSYFPKLKIVARGNEIKLVGEENEIEKFDEILHLFMEYIQRFNRFSEQDIEQLMEKQTAYMQEKEEIDDADTLVFGNQGKIIKARTFNQRRMAADCSQNDLIFAIGPAGSGKTYTAIALAVKAFKNKEVKRIVLTRPAVEAGEHLGFLPGDLKEKLDPYLQPLYDALNDMIPPRKLKDYIEERIVEIAPLAFMRGRTLDNAFVILDEAQNATRGQLKMFLTRMGKTAKFLVTGDITQIDLPDKNASGLVHATKILNNIKGISIIHFDERDIIRHRLVKQIVKAYDIDNK
jgi:phosphate starvation-inducible protein PhoH and related proteins